MVALVIESKSAASLYSSIEGWNALMSPRARRKFSGSWLSMDLSDDIAQLIVDPNQMDQFRQSLYGDSIYGLMNELYKACEIRCVNGFFHHVFLVDHRGTVMAIIGD